MPHKKITGIYRILNKVNGKCYIGSAVTVFGRLTQHKHQLRKGTHFNAHLQSAWVKYGEESFEFSLLEETKLDKDVILSRENFWIDHYRKINTGVYNKRLEASTSIGVRFSEEIKQKLSLAHMGHKRTAEANEKIRQTQVRIVQQFDLEGNFIAEFPSMKDAASQLGIHRTAISMCISGKIKTTGGYKWKLAPGQTRRQWKEKI